jgi:hypothetical protein
MRGYLQPSGKTAGKIAFAEGLPITFRCTWAATVMKTHFHIYQRAANIL